MKNLIYLFLSVLIFSCSSNKSALSIPANEVFVLGELQESSFKASIKNTSDHEIELQVVKTDDKSFVSGFGLPAGSSADIFVSADETALIKNESNTKATVNAIFNKGVEGMSYQPLTLIKPKMLDKDSLLIDINLFEKALTELHPGVYRYNSPEEIKSSFENFKSNLPERMSEAEFMKQLAQQVVKVRCGHTYINPWNMDGTLRSRLYGNKQYFPLGFTVVNGRFIVTENASEDQNIQRGAEIFSINSIPVNTIYKDLSTIAKSDGNNFNPTDNYISLKHYEESYWNAFDIYFPLFYPLQGDSYTVSYRNPDEGSINDIMVLAQNKKERSDNMKRLYGDEILESSKWKLEIINDDLAVMKLGTFAIWNWQDFDYKKWYANAFAKLDSRNIKNLAIDIRGNGGGLSEPKNELISYLIKEELKCEDQGKTLIKTTKLNPSLLPYVETWAKPLIDGLTKEYYRKVDDVLYQLMEPSECVNIQPNGKQYNGKVFIFGDSSNVSATFTLLDQAQSNGFATYVGQPSGGNKQGINGGEYAFFKMPYSKMEVDIPLKYFAPNTTRKDEGLSPDYSITTTQEDITQNRDPYLEFVKSKI